MSIGQQKSEVKKRKKVSCLIQYNNQSVKTASCGFTGGYVLEIFAGGCSDFLESQLERDGLAASPCFQSMPS